MVAAARPGQHHKRHGKHQKHNRHFLKVYSPYLPLLIIVSLIGVLTIPGQKNSQTDVLGYATNLNSHTLLSESNKQRANDGDQPLSLNPLLNQAAQNKANDMAKRDYWSHTTPDGLDPWTFIAGVNYQYKKAGENLAYGFDTSHDAVTGWMNSAPHRDNLLDGTYQEVGFGIANSPNYQHSGPETIVVAMYGTPQTAIVPASADDQGVKAYSTNNQSGQQPQAVVVGKAQLLTSGSTPWIMSALGVVVAVGLVLLMVKHSLALRKAVKRGERFVLKHPLLDVTIIALLVLCVLVMQTQGVIL